MRLRIAFALVAGTALAQGPQRHMDLPQMLARIAEYAEAFGRIAPTTLSEETLEQRSRTGVGADEFAIHEVVSEYGYAGPPIHEMRKVISVDNKQVTSLAKARQAMSLGLTSADDKLKKRLLEDFEKHGLHGAVTDFGQVLLLFSTRGQRNYKFELHDERMVSSEQAIAIGFQQTGGPEGMTVFRMNAAQREPLRGEILVRKADAVPMRITMQGVQTVKNVAIKDESTVDYLESPFGCVLPVSVVHREYGGEQLLTENAFRYAQFRKLEGAPLKVPDSMRGKD